VPRGENVDLCLQVTLVHGSALGTATPKQPKINLWHIVEKTRCHSCSGNGTSDLASKDSPSQAVWPTGMSPTEVGRACTWAIFSTQ
jgi:hypothetical protein